MFSFGYSSKPEDSISISKYGTGFKHGALHLGSEIIVCSQKDDNEFCVVFLSKKYNEDKESDKIGQVLVPIAS